MLTTVLTYPRGANIDSGTASRLCQRSSHDDRVCFQKRDYFDYTCSVSLSEVSTAMIGPRAAVSQSLCPDPWA